MSDDNNCKRFIHDDFESELGCYVYVLRAAYSCISEEDSSLSLALPQVILATSARKTIVLFGHGLSQYC